MSRITIHESMSSSSIDAGPIAWAAPVAALAASASENGRLNATTSAPLPLTKSRRESCFSVIVLTSSSLPYAIALEARDTARTMR